MQKLLTLAFLFFIHLSVAQSPDNIKAIQQRLVGERALLRRQLTNSKADAVPTLRRMMALGQWTEAMTATTKLTNISTVDRLLLRAEHAWLTNDFRKAESLVKQVLEKDPADVWANRQQATLLIEAWRLPQAVALCNTLLARDPADDETALVLGRALLLQKRYPDALAIAKRLQKANPNLAPAYLLEANVYFWDQQPEQAVAPLVRSLMLDPFNADARFSYGYAIWRRIDATQLNAMADQWQLALDLNPLHFQTHWHWGNGHTNRTYADYADKNEKAIRDTLRGADRLFRARKLPEALAVTAQAERLYPASVLPAMHRASLLYSEFDAPNRVANLDSAEAIFRRVLTKKAHYGPAHNGLSAVIKSKRIPYLAQYDSVMTTIRNAPIPDPDLFSTVFPDLSYYAGTFARNMVWNQLYTSVAYFPLLAKQGNSFVVPPLHIDLSLAMRSPYFRYATTFDNRQWMDIRGVGSGAAAIEYVERGAWEERNVVLHEYVHLFHGRVLTDKENRRIRSLYYKAMQEKRTLDYYSQNNESEYLAQTYPAYFETVKVHPLDFKSMNIRAELKAKDPGMYGFLDSLITKEKAALAGDKRAMASNWAQVYLNLSSKYTKTDPARAARLLDTALVYDRRYQPAYLAYARVKGEQKQFDIAREYINIAQSINQNYAPAYVALADWEKARQVVGATNHTETVAAQAKYLQKAVDLENDYQTRAQMAVQLRETYLHNAQIVNAIRAAEAYAPTSSTISTYLRDKRDEALAFAAAHRAMLGYTQPLDLLRKQVAQRPQNYELRGLFADALLITGKAAEAVQTIAEAQRILASTQNARTDFSLRLAEGYAALGRIDSLRHYLGVVLADKGTLDPMDKQRLVRLMIRAGQSADAKKLFDTLPTDIDQLYRASAQFSIGMLAQQSGKPEHGIGGLMQAIALNPYDLDAQRQLAEIYRKTNLSSELAALKKAAGQLGIRFGDAAGL
ncbi:MAG: hypothetical protein EAZ91_19070 [Cytophagales bacterium]|nr:MAG: hypothetical protein EAZ91_19070 [Cytophagales bacterium]